MEDENSDDDFTIDSPDIDYINYLYGMFKISNMLITKLRYIGTKNSVYVRALENHIIITSNLINYLSEYSIYIKLPVYINTKYYPIFSENDIIK